MITMTSPYTVSRALGKIHHLHERILPIPKIYTFLHRLLTRNPLPPIPNNLQRPIPTKTCYNQEFRIRSCFQIQPSTSDSCSFLPIPELQISLRWLSDHLSSLYECKAEFPEFLHIGDRWEMQEFLVIPAYSAIAHIWWMSNRSLAELRWMQSGISGISAHRESLGNAGIRGHSCLFRNCKHPMDL